MTESEKQLRLENARALLKSLEEDNEPEANRLLDEMVQIRDVGLFQEIGKLTRDLHDSLNSFGSDSRIPELTEKDIPDAKERLNYVITKTEESAHRTLDMVEQVLPMCESLSKQASDLGGQWQKFRAREMEAQEFRDLSGEIDTFFTQVQQSTADIQSKLTEVLMAQDFQDITGQIIRRVISLVQEVEENLVEMVRISGKKMVPGSTSSEKTTSESGKLEGPQVPGLETADVVSGQDDVDDLLSSLGF
ncbi:chemotaxis protein CheZ [Solemya pervernicosa gill symbiont]|uniref:Protein phosphatase CheZ n=1 Tax=Solemya pervernicosa gill symbiont TaxID=642797 RepID=A0A1T2LAZ2_9GAMM|nr:chemotaxis protein CheZ [Solemya pervernicosa gill symbiont]